MIKKCLLLLFVCQAQGQETMSPDIQAHDPHWVVIGAGPAGIVTIAMLLELGTPSHEITWIDKQFNVGDLSSYPNVPANIKNGNIVNVFKSFSCLAACNHPALGILFNNDPNKEYPLQQLIEPLKAVTQFLCARVNFIKDNVESLYFKDNNWRIALANGEFTGTHVVLASGAKPKKLDMAANAKEISLVDALDFKTISTLVTQEDIVAVIGGCHSAVLILKNLSELGVKEVVNLYKTPLKYAEDMGGWWLHHSSGLTGATAVWAKNVLEKNPPKNLRRVLNTPESLAEELPKCTKIVQAFGFERNEFPLQGFNLTYNDETGVIAPRLFGIGIAFPEKYVDPLGNVEHKVGLQSFAEYAHKIVPAWAKTKCQGEFVQKIKMFEDLFDIELL